jgi:hypothetical protein
MLRTYKLKHSINQGKQKKILSLLEEYRKLSTLEKGQKIYLPITTNDYFEGIKGDISNFIQINFQQDIDKIDGNISISNSNNLYYH